VAEFSLDLSEEQRDLRDWVHGFAASTVRPAAAEWDQREETPWPILTEAAKIGLYGFEFLANAWADPTGLSLCLANEELFWGDAGIGLSIMGTSLAIAAIYGAGTQEQLLEWVPPCFGSVEEPAVAAFCSTEPEAGSDVGAIRTRARYDQPHDEWVLSGQKAFATNGGIASVYVVTASVDPSLGTRGQAAFVIPPGTAGVTAGRKLRKLGLRASNTADVFLDEVRVPGRCLLGGREALEERLARARAGQRSAGQVAMRTFERSRPAVGAQAVGIARAAYEYALEYARGRVQFGRPIVEHQAVGFALADMRTEIDAARLLVWRAAWMAKNNRPFEAGEGSMSKLKAGEVAVAVTEKAVQVLGGAGYVSDHPVERWYRDAKIYTIFEGTSEIQRLVISRAIR
jgi:alkylation response protein AidB-like acyl-CoA dehydrogenase